MSTASSWMPFDRSQDAGLRIIGRLLGLKAKKYRVTASASPHSETQEMRHVEKPHDVGMLLNPASELSGTYSSYSCHHSAGMAQGYSIVVFWIVHRAPAFMFIVNG